MRLSTQTSVEELCFFMVNSIMSEREVKHQTDMSVRPCAGKERCNLIARLASWNKTARRKRWRRGTRVAFLLSGVVHIGSSWLGAMCK